MDAMEHRLTALETKWDTVIPTLATKADLNALEGRLQAQMTGVKADVANLKSEVGGLKAEFGQLKTEVGNLKGEMHKGFADQQRWFVGVALALVAAMIGVAGVTMQLMTRKPAVPTAVRDSGATFVPDLGETQAAAGGLRGSGGHGDNSAPDSAPP